MKTTQVTATASGELAAVHAPSRGGIARQHRQPYVIALSLQLGALLSVALGSGDIFLISFDPTLFSHNCVGGVVQQTYPLVKDEFIFFYSFLLKMV